MKPELVIFDCDGVLVDSEVALDLCLVDILTSLGCDYSLEEAFRSWPGKSFENIIKLIEAERNIILPSSIGKTFMSLVPEYQKKYMEAVPGAVAAVRNLSENFNLRVASNGEKENVIASVEQIGLLEIFQKQNIWTQNDVRQPKPAPDIYLHACQKAGVSPDKVAVIEDSKTGILAARAAGTFVIGFNGKAHGKLEESQMRDYGADVVLSTWPEVTDFINAMV